MSFAFLFTVHNHQPAGNFEDVFERAFSECYRPFLEKVQTRPSFKFSLHFSGPLWEYMESRAADCFGLIKELTARGQVELLGGGFYEPILAVIPAADRLGQLNMMSDYLQANFGRRPRGIWLAERVWEPHLAAVLAEAGIEYTLLDEEHFHYAGVKKTRTTYVTEDEGRFIRLFPIDKELRYLIPFQGLNKVGEVLDDMKSLDETAILGDDGEKFGMWPGTAKLVYEDGWLDGFLELLEKKAVPTMTCSEYLDSTAAEGLAYIPPCSYEEMMEWVLEPTEISAYRELKKKAGPEDRRFLRAGFFRDFFRKYRESAALRNRMLLASAEVRASSDGGHLAFRDLYRGQCNDPYWHGVFGGLYLPHLREAAYGSIIAAEERAGIGPADLTAIDMDGDGRPELVSRGRTFNAFIDPGEGGSVFELDIPAAHCNVTDVLSRRRESYHAVAAEGEGGGGSIHELARRLPEEARALLVYDERPRFSAIDRFFGRRALAGLSEMTAKLDLADLAVRPYVPAREGDRLILRANGRIRTESRNVPVAVKKSIDNGPDGLAVGWDINIGEGLTEPLMFCSEWNLLAFPGQVAIEDEGTRLVFRDGLFSVKAEGGSLRFFPLRTLSQSEKGYDIIHQGYCICALWPIDRGTGRISIPDLVIKAGK